MNNHFLKPCLLFLSAGFLCCFGIENAEAQSSSSPAASPVKTWHYPVSPKIEQVDDYHGTKVKDPYRWLEELDSSQTRAWIQAQNELTRGYLGKLPKREAIKNRLTELWNYEKISPPLHIKNSYFYLKNNGLQNQSVLYVTADLKDEGQILLDPNTMSQDGTAALQGMSVSPNGQLLAYGIARAGSDWVEWRVRNIATRQDLPDVIQWTKFIDEVAWDAQNQGFYYSRFPEPAKGQDLKDANFNNKLYYHRLGAPQTADRLIYERPDNKEWQFSPQITKDGRYLIVTINQGTDANYRIYYRDLKSTNTDLKPLIDNFDAEYTWVDNNGPVFLFKSNQAAPRGKLIEIDIRNPNIKNWNNLIPQSKELLENVSRVGDSFVAQYLKDAHSEVRIFSLKGQLQKTLTLPGIGTTQGFLGQRNNSETFYSFVSFNSPAIVYRLDLKTMQSTLFKKPTLKFNPDDFVTTQVFYTSKDGTRIPMFLSHKKGLIPSGDLPTYLYAYGGFNVTITPYFKPKELWWMESGGVVAVPNLRGGGEYGEEWHRAGTKLKKQNVFDDYIAAAEWLIAQRYTNPHKLVIAGASNGGLLVGAALTQRPDLFGAALPAVGVMDMLRFQRFTIGWAWTDDYGSSDNADEFKALYAYSPLHRLKAGVHYPATLITTADHDDRVVPGHSFKFAATMQAAQAANNPVLIRIETKAGHGAGIPTSKKIEEIADILAFTDQALAAH